MTNPGSSLWVGEATAPAGSGAQSSWRETLSRYGPYVLLAGALLIHGLFWLSIFTGNLNFLFNDAIHRRGQGADFFAVYLAGTRALTGGSIYDPTGWQEVVPYLFPYRYVPLPAYTLGIVLAQFAPFQAYHLWILVIELLLFFNLWLAWHLVSSHAQFALVAAGWLAFTPFYMELFMGQFSFVMVTLFSVMGYALLRAESGGGDWQVLTRPWLFGGAWSLSLVWKSNSVLFAPLVVRLRAWRTLLAGAAVLLLTMVPYFWRFPQDWETFARNFEAPTFLGSHAGNFGLHALLMALLRPIEALSVPLSGLAANLPRGVLLVQLAVGLVALISLWATFTPVKTTVRRLLVPTDPRTGVLEGFDPVAGLALWMIVYFLVYRDVWEHHYVMLLPALTLLWLKGEFPRWPVLLAWFFVAVPSLLWLFDRPGSQDPEWFWPYWQSVLYHSSKVVPVLILWAVVVRWLVAKARSQDT